MAFGKPGRPPEDRLARQRQLYLAVAPLLLEVGPRRLSMQRAARAAHVSVGGLYHWFPTKRDLVLHALAPEALARWCDDFHGRAAHLADSDPQHFVAAFVDYAVDSVDFLRPAALAALDLGATAFWDAAQVSLVTGVAEFEAAVAALTPGVAAGDRRRLEQSIRRIIFAALLDPRGRSEELAAELGALIDGYRWRVEPGRERPAPVTLTEAAAPAVTTS